MLILAFGLRDILPTIAGLAERLGKTVLHCLYCPGFEFSDRPLDVLYRTPMSVHQACLIAEWGPTTL
jgi:thioredoxin reductase